MNTFDAFLARLGVALLATILIANLGSSIAVIRSRELSYLQKSARLLCIWLFPVFGAIVVSATQSDNQVPDHGGSLIDHQPSVAFSGEQTSKKTGLKPQDECNAPCLARSAGAF